VDHDNLPSSIGYSQPELFFGRRPAAAWGFADANLHAAPLQCLAEQHLDLGIGAPEIARRDPLDRGVERRIETERKGFFGGWRHRLAYW
jgi:hypothetical protein